MTKRAFGSSAASSRPRLIGTVRSPRRWSTSDGVVTFGRIGRASQARSSSRNAAATSASAERRWYRLSAAISSPLPCGAMRPESICAASGQFVRTKSTSERRVTSGMSLRDDVGAEEHELAHPLRAPARVVARWRGPRTSRRTAIAGSGPTAACTAASVRVFELDRRPAGSVAVREPGADPVVADDPMRGRELLEERARARIVPLLLEVRHPAAAEEEERALAHCRVRDPPAVELGEADVLLHGLQCSWPERAMSTRWPATATRAGHAGAHHAVMQTRHVDGLTIRALRNGDTATVAALFERLGDRSRERRFCGAKPRLSTPSSSCLARVDATHHVLVGYLDGDPEPAGIARLVRDGGPRRSRSRSPTPTRAAASGRSSPASSPPTRAPRESPSSTRRCAATTRPSSRSWPGSRDSLQVRWRGGERELVARLEAGR